MTNLERMAEIQRLNREINELRAQEDEKIEQVKALQEECPHPSTHETFASCAGYRMISQICDVCGLRVKSEYPDEED